MSDEGITPQPGPLSGVSVARIYDYLLGGTNNTEADRKVVEQIKELFPWFADWAWCNRSFHQRAVRWLAENAGIRQFLDIGSGLPTQENTHEIAQRVALDARVVYVDNDATVAERASELLRGSDKSVFVVGDLRDRDSILKHPEVVRVLNFDEPVALLITAVIHFFPDEDDPWGIVRSYLDELPSGSYLVLSSGTHDNQSPTAVQRAVEAYQNATSQLYPRSKAEIERFFEGLELVPPYEGAAPEVTFGGLWGADVPELADDEGSRALYVGVARKP
ncbi:SAM-dependent methyltransferase [Thermasporomyces composti]|uniref:S-adenosyl methyltransferase n=1 Tax=Thermasporomyces composti TaxID=696763 RepID=A0A3D9VCG1_THECX|nr:SAM-dependent methyltransferase [Thermasporomyces composti]REF36755.1 S-adenosyl methyltransferase [Thermasporomyces composti]